MKILNFKQFLNESKSFYDIDSDKGIDWVCSELKKKGWDDVNYERIGEFEKSSYYNNVDSAETYLRNIDKMLSDIRNGDYDEDELNENNPQNLMTFHDLPVQKPKSKGKSKKKGKSKSKSKPKSTVPSYMKSKKKPKKAKFWYS